VRYVETVLVGAQHQVAFSAPHKPLLLLLAQFQSNNLPNSYQGRPPKTTIPSTTITMTTNLKPNKKQNPTKEKEMAWTCCWCQTQGRGTNKYPWSQLLCTVAGCALHMRCKTCPDNRPSGAFSDDDDGPSLFDRRS